MRYPTLAAALACLPVLGCAASPTSIDLENAPGWAQLELGDAGGALASFDSALESSQRAELHAGRARALFLLGRLAEARAGYDAAIEREPDEPQWRVGLSLVELASGDVGAATTACDAAIELDPRLAKAHYNRGYARLRARDHEGAVADFTRAILLEPDCAEAYNCRGVALARTGRFDAALVDFQQAGRLAPLAAAHGNSAAAHYALGDARSALSELNSAVRLERANPLHYAQRGRIYLDLGEADVAAAEFEQALALAPAHPEVARLLARSRALADPLALRETGTPEQAAHSLTPND